MIARALITHLWQSTIVAVIAWLVTLVLRRDRAGVRYAVWLASSLKFLVPFAVLTSAGQRLGWRPAAVSTIVPLNVAFETIAPLSAAPARLSAHQSMASASNAAVSWLPFAATAVWALGAVMLLGVWIIRWRRVAAVVRSSMPLTSGPVVGALRRHEREAGLTLPIAVVSSSGSIEPGIVGIVTPTLVWPSRIDEHLSEAQIGAIVAHEVAHVRRRDNLAAACHMGVQAAFWFHPFVWWIGARLVDERERACDEAVVRAGSEPRTYAESILKTCQFCVEAPLACVAGVTGSELKRRIEHIMTNDVRGALGAWKKWLLATAASAAIVVPLLAGVLHVRPVFAQQPPSNVDAAFDVTSVKPNSSGSGRIMMMPAANGGWQASNVTLGMLVRMAFQLEDSRIIGGPNWLFEDRFDVVGTGAAPDKDGPLLVKMRTLLADRFHLITHMEQRELPFYQLVLARRDGKLGAQVTPSTANCSPPSRGRGLPADLPPPPPPPAPGERLRCGIMVGPGRLAESGQTMEAFAISLSRFVGGIVVDKTNLPGMYDLTLTYAPDPGLAGRGDLPPLAGGPPPIANTDAPSIFAALQEQLGLKLESTKGPVDVLVIDSAEKPTED